MAHEKSITFKNKQGRWANYKSVHGGKQLKQGTIEKWAAEGRVRPLGGKTFGNQRDAVRAAKERSDNFRK